MSKKKRVVELKANVIVSIFELKDQDIWSPIVAEAILADDDPNKSWKGVIKIYPTHIELVSKTKTYKKKFDFDKIRGLLSPPYNNKLLVLGISDEKMMYFIIKCENNKDRQEINSKIIGIKDPDNARNNESEHVIDSININEETNKTTFYASESAPKNDMSKNNQTPGTSEDRVIDNTGQNITYIHAQPVQNQRSVNKREAPKPPEISDIVIKTNGSTPLNTPINSNHHNNHIISKSEIMSYKSPTIQSDELSDDSDVTPGTWVEDVKYISYEPTMGGNVECDDGSVYMYTAHQIVSNNSYSLESDSDSN